MDAQMTHPITPLCKRNETHTISLTPCDSVGVLHIEGSSPLSRSMDGQGQLRVRRVPAAEF